MEENQNFTFPTKSATQNGFKSAATTESAAQNGFETATATEPFTQNGFESATTESFTQNGFETATTTEQFTSASNYNGAAVNSAAADGAAGGFVEKQVNYLTGTIGALPGVIVGIVLWIIISKLGYIAGIAGIVMMLCSLKGFELFGGRISIPGIVICVVLDLIAVYFAHNIACAIEIMDAMKEYSVANYSFSEAYKAIPEFMKMDEFKSAYYHDLIIGYVLTILGIASVFRRK